MISVLISRLVLLVFGTLYPAYASYKTVKTKNVRDYVKWMMYWIVFAAYTFIEIFTDIFLAFWFPFYYELKILFVLWLVCPATRGSTYIFRKVINPHLSKHELVIDSYIAALWDHGYDLVRKIGAQGMDYLIEIILELFRKGQLTITNFMPQITEIAQNSAVPQAKPPKDIVSDINAVDEDFIIMTDNSEIDEAIPTRASNPRSANDSCSESEDVSEKTSKVKTKSKKVTTVRQRKR